MLLLHDVRMDNPVGIILSDSFNRSNQSLVGSTADGAFGGSTWTWLSDPNQGTSPVISGNRVMRGGGTGSRAARTPDLPADIRVRCTLQGATTAGPILFGRRNPDETNFIALSIGASAGVTMQVRINSSTVSSQNSATGIVSIGSVLEIEVIGTAIRALVDGVQRLSYSNAGVSGMNGYSGGIALTNATSAWDDFIAEEIV